MSIEDKQKRLKELSRPSTILSDQEYEEKERLEEELSMIHQEETKTFKENNIDVPEKSIVVPKKRSILDIILEKIKKKPATWEEIQQLKLEKQRAVLKKDIAVANHIRKNPGGKQKSKKMFSTTNKDIDNAFNSSARDFSSMVGSNGSKNKYKDLTG